MSIYSKMTAIADAIREKTGGTDPLTLDAMAEAIAGIEAGGGSSGGASSIYMAKITHASDVGNFNVIHNLGTKDILFALCFAENLNGITPASNTNIVAKFWANTDIPVRYGVTAGGGFSAMYSYDTANARADYRAPNSGSYWDAVVDENTFKFHRGISGYTYIAGVTYTVIIMAESAFSATEV